MPLNTLRLNHRPSTHPNERIVFIKPLPRPAERQDEYRVADAFLRAIAAQCLPIMKTHWLSVTTLEEFEPNAAFLGRNFNAGECIQLVLRKRNPGGEPRWLPFDVVQMVMMHELAHNVHMNHGRAFWATRDALAADLRALWARGYTGDGFWGGGRSLDDLNTLIRGDGGPVGRADLAQLPLCGGTYRSRRAGGKRKRKRPDAPSATWKEKKERRIEKKFGKNGVSLGADEEARMVLELGRKGGGGVGVKPRVAGSKRGRELRAAAALKRFEVAKAEEKQQQVKEEKDDDEASDNDDYEDDDNDNDDNEEYALDIDGSRLQDKDGRAITRVCDDDDDDVHIKQELQELEGLVDRYYSAPAVPPTTEADAAVSCPVCSLANPARAATCTACAHVLDTGKDPRHWTCASAACQAATPAYINGGDAGVCGLCGERRRSLP